jgi:ATP-dependent DNA helicase RecQ
LFEQLRALRATLAVDRGLPPYVIFHDRSLIQMATLYPCTPETLAQIYGVGLHKVAQYSPHILPIIQKYCQENVVQPDQRPLPPNQLPTSISGRRRMVEVWERFQKGETVDSIAEGFGFKPKTIINHLKNAFASGRPLRVDGLEEMSTLTTSEVQQVLQAFETLGGERLTPIFEALDQMVSYDQLHLWRLIYQALAAENSIDK